MNKENLTLEDYNIAMDLIRSCFERVDEEIRPVSILQNGNIEAVGISDVDLIFVLPNDFQKGKEFLSVYSEVISNIPFNKKLFIHLPMIVSKDHVHYVPKYTFNPANKLNLIFGEEIDFASQTPNIIQSILISLEFIQFRLFQLMNMYNSGAIDQHGVLLRGHSLKHSIDLAHQACIDLSLCKFTAFKIIEDIRGTIHSGTEVTLDKSEVNSLAIGVIKEFYQLYQLFSKAAESHVEFYLPYEDQYEYDENVFLTDLFNQNSKIQFHFLKGRVAIQGFHWINMLLRDIYFGVSDSTSLIVDPEFYTNCIERAAFHKEQMKWNKKVFGAVNVGISPMPSLIGKKAEYFYNKYWGI